MGLSRSSSPSSGFSSEKFAIIGTGTPRGMAENPMERIRHLVASMRRRLAYVIRARGGGVGGVGKDTPDTDATVSDELVKHVYSLFKNIQTSNLSV